LQREGRIKYSRVIFRGAVHEETVVLLSKLHAKQHIEVELNLDEMDLTTAKVRLPMTRLKPMFWKNTA
jgi:23S rRNA (uracil1939-C5)-methyltransferase